MIKSFGDVLETLEGAMTHVADLGGCEVIIDSLFMDSYIQDMGIHISVVDVTNMDYEEFNKVFSQVLKENRPILVTGRFKGKEVVYEMEKLHLGIGGTVIVITEQLKDSYVNKVNLTVSQVSDNYISFQKEGSGQYLIQAYTK